MVVTRFVLLLTVKFLISRNLFSGFLTPTKGILIIEFSTHIKHICHSIYRADRLTWHNGLIPEDEVWVKIGGDKGGGSFKMSVQIANVPKPNSINNTFVFCSFEAGDSVTNLLVGLAVYQTQGTTLSTTQWKYAD